MSMMPPMIPGAGEQQMDIPMGPAGKGMDRFNAAAEGKQRKTDEGVNYRKAEGGDRCSDCAHWDGEEGCELVAGRIAPDGLCDLHETLEPEAMPDGAGDLPPEEGALPGGNPFA
jgi:hypothetical protein